MSEIPEDELPEDSTGYQVGRKVTREELLEIDAEDESLRKWKESLGVAALDVPQNERQVIVDEFRVLIDGRDPLIFSLRTPEDIQTLADSRFILKENCKYRFQLVFRVFNEIVIGLRFMNFVYKKKVRVDKSDEMIGSYNPRVEAYDYTFAEEIAPSGMLGRGVYTAKSRFIDDDRNLHLEYRYSFRITKNWED